MRLGPCKIDLVILYYLSFQGDTSVVVLFVLCFGVDFVLFELMYVLVLGLLTGWPPIGK